MAGVGGCLMSGMALGASEQGVIEGWLGGPTRTPSARRGVDPRAVNRVRTRARQVALTFDDGPDPAYTPAVLDLLARYDARATFFVIGRNADRHTDLVRRILAEGHQLANHTQQHTPLETARRGQIRQELAECATGIARVGGGEPAYYRPPRGYTSRVVAQVGDELGERAIYWSDCLEARLRVAGPTAGAELGLSAEPGEIVLAHDGGHLDGPNAARFDRGPTVEALDPLLSTLRGRGLTPVTVDTLLAGAVATV